VQRGLAAGHRNRANAAFQGADALLQHRVGRVADAAVDMARPFQIEQRLRVVAGLKDERGGEVNGQCAGAGGRVGRRACVQGQGVKTGIGVAGHEDLSG